MTTETYKLLFCLYILTKTGQREGGHSKGEEVCYNMSALLYYLAQLHV